MRRLTKKRKYFLGKYENWIKGFLKALNEAGAHFKIKKES